MVLLKKPDNHLEDLLKREGILYQLNNRTGKYLFITQTANQLIISNFPDVPTEIKSCLRKIKYIAPDKSGLLDKVGIVDINAHCLIPELANIGISDRGSNVLYLTEVLGQGKWLVIPFSLNELLKHRGITPKKFWARASRLPYEDVAFTDRGGVRRLFLACLKHLWELNNLPFVKISCNPGMFLSTFAFRVDTDYSSPTLIEKSLRLSEKVGMRWTWFVTTGDKPAQLKAIINILKGQDIQLHCHRHQVYADVAQNKANYAEGKEILSRLGISPLGVAAPFGEWNENLQQAFAELGFKYSSEFGYSYDDLPERPLVNGQRSAVLQIPIHPISLGRLAEAKMERKKIFDYYARIIDLQCSRLEPCFLYDHPKWIVYYEDVLKDILQYGLERCGNWVTLTDYCHWWQLRESVNYQLQFKDGGFDLTVEQAIPEISLVIEHSNQIAFVPIKNQPTCWNELKWIETPRVKKFNSYELYTRRADLMMQIKRRLQNYRRRIKNSAHPIS